MLNVLDRDPALALRFRLDVDATESFDGASNASLQITPLRYDAITLSETIGSTYPAWAVVPLSGGQFSIMVDGLTTPAEGNPLQDGESLAFEQVVLRGAFSSLDEGCTEMDGHMVEPLVCDLSPPGDTCVILRAGNGMSVTSPDVNTYDACPTF